MKIQIFVMPEWIAGIQVRKDASGNIHVNLDSSTPCWNDAIEGFCLKLIETLRPAFSKKAKKRSDIFDYKLPALRVLFRGQICFVLYLGFGYMLSINTTLKSCQSHCTATMGRRPQHQMPRTEEPTV